MINHARCLLMNVPGELPPYLDVTAEEVVDPDYRPVAVPTPLAQVRRVLFGSSPDRWMMNYRCRQLLTLTHATSLVDYLTALDPRITYATRAGIDAAAWTPVVTPTRETAGTLTVLGEDDPPDATGRVCTQLLVRVDAAGVASVERLTVPFSKVDFEFAAGDKLPLTGTGRSFRLSSEDAGQIFRVQTFARPRRDLGVLADTVAGLGEPTQNYVFGVTKAEPYLTFRNLWTRKKELPLRLGALVCALAYRTEEVRNAERG